MSSTRGASFQHLFSAECGGKGTLLQRELPSWYVERKRRHAVLLIARRPEAPSSDNVGTSDFEQEKVSAMQRSCRRAILPLRPCLFSRSQATDQTVKQRTRLKAPAKSAVLVRLRRGVQKEVVA